MLKEQAILEFKEIYKKEFGVTLDLETARQKAESVFLFFTKTMCPNGQNINLPSGIQGQEPQGRKVKTDHFYGHTSYGKKSGRDKTHSS